MRKRVIAAYSGGRRREAVRSTAAALAVLLVFASVVPSFALAEKDTEAEGTSPPGALPGLEVGMGGELAGEETSLEEVTVEPGETEAEEVASDAEAELPETGPAEPVAPPTSAEAPQPTPAVPAAPVEAVPAPTAETPIAVPPVTGGPVYGAEESPPTYEPSQPPAVPVEAVQNETITAPASSGSQEKVKAKAAHEPSSAEAADSDSTPTEPTPAPTAVVVPAAPAAQPDRPGALVGRRSHVVVGGECLWSIATALLPPGASATEIAEEVHRLWQLNSARIGTGDPNMLPVGIDLLLV
jgi:hypothetical protein